MSVRHLLEWQYPLHWPSGQARSEELEDARFDHSLSVHAATLELDDELCRLGADAEGRLLSSNLRLRLSDGSPISKQSMPEDRGVALYFTLDGQPTAFACDRWYRLAHNMRALSRTIGALRGIDRWGCSTVKQAFAGYAALPERAAATPWWELMGIAPTSTAQEVNAAYRAIIVDRGLHLEGADQNELARWARVRQQALATAR